MAFVVQEKALCINNGFTSALLVSFLDESLPGEEYNHEQLASLMRSLAAEINPNTMDVEDLIMEPESPSDGNESQGSQSIELDVEWPKMEPTPSSSPSHDMNWHMDVQGDKVDALIENVADNYSDIYFDDVLEGQIYATSWAELDAIEM